MNRQSRSERCAADLSRFPDRVPALGRRHERDARRHRQTGNNKEQRQSALLAKLQVETKENKKKEDVEEDSQDDIEILDEIVPHDQKRVNEQMDNIKVEQKITAKT